MARLSAVNKRGQKVKILQISDGLEEKNHLLSLGLLLGDVVEIIYPSFFGRPITIRCTNQEILALRKEQAEHIDVEFVQAS